MDIGLTLPCAHLLGLRKTIPVANTARRTGATLPKPTEKPVPPIRRVAAASKAAPARRAPGSSKPAFAHLLPAADSFHYENAIDAPPSMTTPSPVSGLAAKIVAAAAKAKTPTGTGVSVPTGLAAKILAAGRKRRAGNF